MWITSSLATAKTPTAIALGNFDGVHLGHQEVIAKILPTGSHPQPANSSLLAGHSRYGSPPHPYLSESRGQLSPAGEGHHVVPVPTVVTFHPHPEEFFSGQMKLLLSPLPEKVRQLMTLGVEQLVLLPFNQELARLSPQDFVHTLLLDQLQGQHISVGEDFRFGRQRQGTVETLRTLAGDRGIEVSVASLKRLNGQRISSSRIRQALAEGDLTTAGTLLGRPYSLSGEVVKGQQIGRTIGFPTANLRLPAEKFIPRFGVYSVLARGVPGRPSQAMPGVMNVGVRPTVQGETPSVEVHLLDWSGALYGHHLTVTLHQYLRPEQTFPSLDALKMQIQADCQAAIETLTVGNLL